MDNTAVGDFVTHVEREMVGAALMRPEVLDRARVQPRYLRDPRLRILWQTMVDLRKAGKMSDSMDLCRVVGENPDLSARCGGLAVITSHMDTTTPERFGLAERTVLAHYQRTGLRDAALKVIAGLKDGEETEAVDDRLRRDLEDLGRAGQDYAQPVSALAELVVEQAEQESSGQRAPYIATGWAEWDKRQDWLGWRGEGVTLIMARSGMGKTSLLNTAAVRLAAAGVPVVLHGTETSAKGRVRELCFGIAGVDPKRFAALARWAAEGSLRRESEEELENAVDRYREAAAWMGRLPILVSGAGLTVETLRREVSRHVAAERCRVLIVDYLQDFVVSDGVRSGDKGALTTHVSREIKDLSATLGIPVLCGAQVSGEKDGVGRGQEIVPQLWDVQWSSSSHQDAEEVFALNRGDYWRDRLEDQYRADKHGRPGVIDIHCRKRRVGALGMISLPFNGPLRWVGDELGPRARLARDDEAQPGWNR